MLSNLGQDVHRLKTYSLIKYHCNSQTLLTEPAFWAVFWYRVGHFFWCKRLKIIGRFFFQINSFHTGADIQPFSDIGGGLILVSPCGTNISGKVGSNVLLNTLAGIGGSQNERDIGAGLGLPMVGSNVIMNAHSAVQRAVYLADGIVLGVGVGVKKNIEAKNVCLHLVNNEYCEAENSGKSDNLLPREIYAKDEFPETCGCQSPSIKRVLYLIGSDVKSLMKKENEAPTRFKFLLTLLNNAVLIIAVHRFAHYLFLKGFVRIAAVLTAAVQLLSKLSISYESCIGESFWCPHLSSVYIKAIVGSRVTVFANGVIAPEYFESTKEPNVPRLLDDILISGHGAVLGAVQVGSHTVVSPKVLLARDVGQNTLVVDAKLNAFKRSDKEILDQFDDAKNDDISNGDHNGYFSFRRFRSLLKADLARAKRLRAIGSLRAMVSSGYLCLCLFRVARVLYVNRWFRLSKYLSQFNQFLFGADISPRSEIGAAAFILKPAGLQFYGKAGRFLTMLPQSAVGPVIADLSDLGRNERWPRLGNDVWLSPRSGFFGNITVGHHVRLGAGVYCSKNTEANRQIKKLPSVFRGRLKV